MSKKKLNALCDQSEIDAYFQQELASAQELLPVWDGSFAEFYEFHRAIHQVTLRLKHSDHEGCLYITCDSPVNYIGPFEWVNSNIRLIRENSICVVCDEPAGVRLEAHVVDVAVISSN